MSPTLEERVAALEATLADLTEQVRDAGPREGDDGGRHDRLTEPAEPNSSDEAARRPGPVA